MPRIIQSWITLKVWEKSSTLDTGVPYVVIMEGRERRSKLFEIIIHRRQKYLEIL